MVCTSCPRKCGVDRFKSIGVCGVGIEPKVAKAYLHKWEEPVISGVNGSGTVFFSGCNLKCVYCQNYLISHNGNGKYITIERLSEIFKELEMQGATNINLVSPSHYVDAIIKALDIYRPNIPIVYNTSGYDSMENLEKLKDYVDIFLVDFKYFSEDLAQKYSNAKNYPEVVKSAVVKMRELQPKEIIENDVMKKGVIIRHLVLPNATDDSIEILKWIKNNIKDPFVSLMGQFTPMHECEKYTEINRKIKPIEYKRVENYMLTLGIKNGYTQELVSADSCYVPNFDMEGVEKKS